jgi:hypothetical protein
MAISDSAMRQRAAAFGRLIRREGGLAAAVAIVRNIGPV